MSTSQLYESLGWADVASKPQWANTCAVRLHLALLDAGETGISGRFPVLAGKHKGKRIEVSQNRLADNIERSGRYGAAIKLTNSAFYADGFKKLSGQGHRFVSAHSGIFRRAYRRARCKFMGVSALLLLFRRSDLVLDAPVTH